MNSSMCGAVAMTRPPGSLFTALDELERAASRPPGSLFTALDELERAASRLPAIADYATSVVDRYLGPPAEVCCSEPRPKEPDDSNVVRRLIALTRRIDEAASAIDHNLNRLSE